jgi:hypothetical protein
MQEQCVLAHKVMFRLILYHTVVKVKHQFLHAKYCVLLENYPVEINSSFEQCVLQFKNLCVVSIVYYKNIKN